MNFREDHKIRILGISAYYHDSAAALVIDGSVVAAAHEERFSRKKHDDSFPVNSIKYVLSEYGLSIEDLDAVVFYDKPYIKFERLLETYHSFAPSGLKSFVPAVSTWVKEKLFTKSNIWKELKNINGGHFNKKPQLLFSEHHLSHAGSAYYPSRFLDAAILTVDGVGEWATATISHGKDGQIRLLKEVHFPHSAGLLYSAFTYYLGFKVNSGEYKLMGLAPYGRRGSKEVEDYKSKILANLIDLKSDGSITLNMEYFDFATGLRMCNDEKWQQLFGFPKRPSDQEIGQEHMDLALAAQEVLEDSVIKMAKTAKDLTGSKNLVMAGGVALNCVSNSKILLSGMFEDMWVQPASGDAGGALGAALAAYYIYFEQDRKIENNVFDGMNGSYLGPEFSDLDTIKVAQKYGANYEKFDSYDRLVAHTAKIISEGNVVGWMQGRMEWGPRALGARSILGDPRNLDMQKKLNLKIKYREGFRPFAPSVLEEDASVYFEMSAPSPYMLFTFPVSTNRRLPLADNSKPLYERLYSPRSDLPSITHLDYSARVQTVSKDTNLKYWQLLNKFKEITGCGVLINTSFNVRGEPIVCTPEDAYLCFMNTEMDYLVIGGIIFDKKNQPIGLREKISKKYEDD